MPSESLIGDRMDKLVDPGAIHASARCACAGGRLGAGR
jgi:hypothetical protein